MNIKIIALSSAIGLAVIAGSVGYVLHTTQQINSLKDERAELNQLLINNKQQLDTLQQEYIRAYSIIEKTNEKFSEIRQQNEELRDRISDNRLEELAREKPGLIEGIVNKASSDSKRCLELMSGAKLNDEEKNAKSPKEFNSQCPWLYDRLVGE